MLRSTWNFRQSPHRMSCTLFLKNVWNFLKPFLVIVILIYISYFCVKKRFLNSFYDMLWTIFHLFQYCNITTDCYVRTSEEKKVEKTTLNFFSYSDFRIFSKICLHILCYISVSIPDSWKILTVMCSRDMGLWLQTLSAKYFCPTSL